MTRDTRDDTSHGFRPASTDADPPPTPGSPAARFMGCSCPSEQGQGFQGLYWIDLAGCPLHGNPDAAAEIERGER